MDWQIPSIRPGYTGACVDLMALAGLRPCGVLCELTNPDGTMARLSEILRFSEKHGMPMLTIEDLVDHHKRGLKKAG